jgi:hypothetical protein
LPPAGEKSGPDFYADLLEAAETETQSDKGTAPKSAEKDAQRPAQEGKKGT